MSYIGPSCCCCGNASCTAIGGVKTTVDGRCRSSARRIATRKGARRRQRAPTVGIGGGAASRPQERGGRQRIDVVVGHFEHTFAIVLLFVLLRLLLLVVVLPKVPKGQAFNQFLLRRVVLMKMLCPLLMVLLLLLLLLLL